VFISGLKKQPGFHPLKYPKHLFFVYDTPVLFIIAIRYTNGSVMSENPYEPSGSAYGNIFPEVNVDLSQAELIRTSHLSHEANLQSIGCLYILGGILGLFIGLFYCGTGISMATNMIPQRPGRAPVDFMVPGLMLVGLGVVVLGLSCFQLYAGRTMQTLNAKGKIPAIIVSAIGLLAFPCGTLISAVALYLLLSPKGEMIYSPQYKEIVQATPHIRYKTSIIVWILLFLLLGLIALGIIAVSIGG
jgi:hypothetical protein